MEHYLHEARALLSIGLRDRLPATAEALSEGDLIALEPDLLTAVAAVAALLLAADAASGGPVEAQLDPVCCHPMEYRYREAGTMVAYCGACGARTD